MHKYEKNDKLNNLSLEEKVLALLKFLRDLSKFV